MLRTAQRRRLAACFLIPEPTLGMDVPAVGLTSVLAFWYPALSILVFGVMSMSMALG
jgi:hypothetical protein